MKKIIRIASVIALASASLLYVGCTKDFSGDITRLENTDTELSKEIKDVNDALESFKSTANAAIEANAAEIAKKADKTTVDALKKEIDDLKPLVSANASDIAQLKKDVKKAGDDATEALKRIGTAENDIKDINKAIETINGRLDVLEGQVAALQVRINSIEAFPAVAPELVNFKLGTVVATTTFDAKFIVSPKEAASVVTEDNLHLVVKEGITKADASAPEFTISKVSVKDGIVSVHATAQGNVAPADGKKMYYGVYFDGKDKDGNKYDIVSGYVPAAIAETTVDLQDPSIYEFWADGEKVEGAPIVRDSIQFGDTKTVKSLTPITDLRIKGMPLDKFAELIGVKGGLVADYKDTTIFYSKHFNGTYTDNEENNDDFEVVRKKVGASTFKINKASAPVGRRAGVLFKDWTVNNFPIEGLTSLARVNICFKEIVVDLGTFDCSDKWSWKQFAEEMVIKNGEDAVMIAEKIIRNPFTVLVVDDEEPAEEWISLESVTGGVKVKVNKNVPYVSEATTKNVVWYSIDRENKYMVKLAFKAPVCPEDVEIDLGTEVVDDFVAFNENYVADVDAQSKVMAAFSVAAAEKDEFLRTVWNGRTPALPSYLTIKDLNLKDEEVTYLKADLVDGEYDTYESETVYEVNGVTITFKHALTINKPASVIAVKTPYVINDTVLVGGEILPVETYIPVERPAFIPEWIWNWIKGYVPGGSIEIKDTYVLDATPMAQYFEVEDAVSGLWIKFSDKVTANPKPELTEWAKVTSDGSLDETALLDWNGYNNKFYDVTATLVTPGGVVLDTKTITFMTENALTVESKDALVFEHKSIHESESETILNHIEIKSLKNGASLIDGDTFDLEEALPYALAIEFADADEWTEKDGKDISNFGEIFSIVNTGDGAWVPALKLKVNQALFQDVYTVSVPYTITYNYGNVEERVLTVIVK